MPTRWLDDTTDWICCNKKYINEIARELKVSPEAIAGAMAKEHQQVLTNPLKNSFLDSRARNCLR